jgi:GNAT superfamily N-acetyltransferase
MPRIRFSIQVDTEDKEPSRVVRRIEGTVYRYAGEFDVEEQIGSLCCFLVQPGLAEEKDVSLFDAMDSISDEAAECYESVFDPGSDGWNTDIEDLYSGGPIGSDLLFIDRIELDPKYRGKGIGRVVVREAIETFGLQCGLVVCKPFPLEYSGWTEQLSAAEQGKPEVERDKADALERVRKFWTKCGFVRLLGSEFYCYCPELVRQPETNRPKGDPIGVPRGRRKLHHPERR